MHSKLGGLASRRSRVEWGRYGAPRNSKSKIVLQASTPARMVDILGCLVSGVDEILSVTKTYEAVSL